jgi:hypothetical protein
LKIRKIGGIGGHAWILGHQAGHPRIHDYEVSSIRGTPLAREVATGASSALVSTSCVKHGRHPPHTGRAQWLFLTFVIFDIADSRARGRRSSSHPWSGWQRAGSLRPQGVEDRRRSGHLQQPGPNRSTSAWVGGWPAAYAWVPLLTGIEVGSGRRRLGRPRHPPSLEHECDSLRSFSRKQGL